MEATLSRRALLRAGAAGCGAALVLGRPHIARAAPITLKFAHPDSVQHPFQKMFEEFAKTVEEGTGGEVRVRVYGGGQLGSSANIVSGVGTGTVDMVVHTAGFFSSYYPKMQVFDLPFVFPNGTVAERVLAGPVGNAVFGSLEEKGVTGLCYGHHGWRVMETNGRPIVQPADLDRMKIRIQQSPMFAAMFKAVGAVPVVLDVAELYLALSQNAVQGIEIPLASLVASKLHEVVTYVSLTNHVYNASALLMNKAKFDSLGPKNGAILRELSGGLSATWRKTAAESSDAARKVCEEKGIKFNTVDHKPFRDRMQPVYDEFRPVLGADLVDQVLKETAI